MKSILYFTLSCLFALNLNAQGIMAIGEIEVKSQQAFQTAVTNWMTALKKGMDKPDQQSSFFRKQGSNTVYWAQWHESIEAMIAMQRKQEASEEKIRQALMEQNMDPLIFEQFNNNTKFNELSVWEYIPELSSAHETWSPLSETEKNTFRYRRVQFFSVAMNANEAFEANRKKIKALDDQMGNTFHLAVFRSVFGKRNADYMVVVIDRSRIAYHENLGKRMKKRQKNDEWQAVWNANQTVAVRKWGILEDENWMKIADMDF